jgi:hypothetical protein
MFELTDQAFVRVQPCLPAIAGAASHGATTARSRTASYGSCIRPAMARCPRAIRALADLLQPTAPLAAGRNLAQDLGSAGRRRFTHDRRGQTSKATLAAARAGGDAAAATTTLGGVHHTNRPAATAPRRSRPGSGPGLANDTRSCAPSRPRGSGPGSPTRADW